MIPSNVYEVFLPCLLHVVAESPEDALTMARDAVGSLFKAKQEHLDDEGVVLIGCDDETTGVEAEASIAEWDD